MAQKVVSVQVQEIDETAVVDQFAEFGLQTKELVDFAKKLIWTQGPQFEVIKSTFEGINFRTEIQTEDRYIGRLAKAEIYRLDRHGSRIVAEFILAQEH